MDAPQEDWQRLGKLLQDRRRWLGYKRRAPFAHAKGLSHDRTLADMEKARRTSYRPSTIEQIEQVYEWAPGSVETVLAGGEPATVEASMPERGRRARIDEFTREEILDELARRERTEIERERRRRLAQELAQRGVPITADGEHDEDAATA